MSISAVIEPRDNIRVAPPRQHKSSWGELQIPFVVHIAHTVNLHADREQLTRLRDAITAALDGAQ